MLNNKGAYQFWIGSLISSFLLNFYHYRWNKIRLSQEISIGEPIPALTSDSPAKNKIKSLKWYLITNKVKGLIFVYHCYLMLWISFFAP
jgi:hypothetical protein